MLVALLFGACARSEPDGSTAEPTDESSLPAAADDAGSGGATTGSDEPRDAQAAAPGASDAGQGTAADPMAQQDASEPTPTTGPDATTPPAGGGVQHGADPTRESAARNGEFKVGEIRSGIRDGSAFADNPTIFYPTDLVGPLSLIALIPGFGAGSFYVRGWAPFLASHGFAVILLDPNSNLDGTAERAEALLDAVESLRAENERADSPLRGRLDVSRVGLTGHSMGGGGCHIAAQRAPWLGAIVPLNPWSNSTDFSMTTVPTLDIAGSADPTAPASQHARPLYESIPESTPKMYIELAGGNHNSADNPRKSPVVARYALSWFKVFLDGDARYRAFLEETPEGVTADGFKSTL